MNGHCDVRELVGVLGKATLAIWKQIVNTKNVLAVLNGVHHERIGRIDPATVYASI